ncbi:hypothetical protein I548_4088 [Mycobacterium intracellulare]|nr:hypothetical protein I548_4088 [Mycobacterium intracellulare]
MAIDGRPPGTVVTGAAWGAALVKPAPTNCVGVAFTDGTPPAAQLGGTDNAPIAGPRPMLASTGAAPTAAGAAGAGADAEVSPGVKLGIPAAPVTGRIAPPPG